MQLYYIDSSRIYLVYSFIGTWCHIMTEEPAGGVPPTHVCKISPSGVIEVISQNGISTWELIVIAYSME